MIFRIYRLFISPVFQLVFNIHCRFNETCSCYTERMIKEKGLIKGAFLGGKRILSCNGYTKANEEILNGS